MTPVHCMKMGDTLPSEVLLEPSQSSLLMCADNGLVNYSFR